ncbi:hypothetical protein HKCCSP123_05405 [Rhodobacterales bacterium HKCCSP123]|nr:hypothetical protein [Rhodobacterales bacterium HKCCSP123]
MKRREAVASFLESETGSFTVEGLPWIVTICVIMTLIYDTAMGYQSYNRVLRSVQDTNRLVSIGAIRDPLSAEELAMAYILETYPGATVTTTIDQAEDYVWTRATIPWSALHLTGWLRLAPGEGMIISAAHRLEWS